MSLVWSVRVEDTLTNVSTYVATVLFAWMVWEFCPKVEHQLWLWRCFLLGYLVTMFSLFYMYVTGTQSGKVRYTGGGANQNDAAIAGVLFIVVAVYLASRQRRRGGLVSWMYWVLVPMAALAVLLTGSRAGLVELVVAVTLLITTLLRRGWKTKILLVAAIACGAILVVNFVPAYLIERATEGTQAGTFVVRQGIWAAGLRQWQQSPLIGCGAGTFRFAVYGPVGGYVAHNVFIAQLVDLGVIGCGFYVMALVSAARSVWRMPAADRPYWAACLTVYFLCALVEGTSAKLTYLLFISIPAMSVAFQAAQGRPMRSPSGAVLPPQPPIIRRPNLRNG
jgi:O-antigen ligase